MNVINLDVLTYVHGKTELDVIRENDNLWMTYKQMAALYNRGENTIIEHIQVIFDSGELTQFSTTRKFRVVATNGKTYDIKHFNLDVIYAVGYRVGSLEAMAFRKWATEHLKNIRNKGVSIEVITLKDNPRLALEAYEAIKKIREDESMIWRSLLELYSTAVDYNKDSVDSRIFIAEIQNSLHYAVHGNTASELLFKRVDHNKPLLGMQSFYGTSLTKKDIYVAKNYMTESELASLKRLSYRLLDLATDLVNKSTIKDLSYWRQKVFNILEISEVDILKGFSSVTRKEAVNKVSKEFFYYQESKTGLKYIIDLAEFKKDVAEVYSLMEAKSYSSFRVSNFEELFVELVTLFVNNYTNDSDVFVKKTLEISRGDDYFKQYYFGATYEVGMSTTLTTTAIYFYKLISSNIGVTNQDQCLSMLELNDSNLVVTVSITKEM